MISIWLTADLLTVDWLWTKALYWLVLRGYNPEENLSNDSLFVEKSWINIDFRKII